MNRLRLRKYSSVWIRLPVLFAAVIATCSYSCAQSGRRDRTEQPERVMDAAGVRPGMVIGEVGAGRGYYTFRLAGRVGAGGRVYANDIDRSALAYLQRRCTEEGIDNVEIVRGDIEDPHFPAGGLDLVFIANAFHDLEKPVELLDNLAASLKPGARVVILDRDRSKGNDWTRHFLTREEALQKIAQSKFEPDRIETFLPYHNIYILRLKVDRTDARRSKGTDKGKRSSSSCLQPSRFSTPFIVSEHPPPIKGQSADGSGFPRGC